MIEPESLRKSSLFNNLDSDQLKKFAERGKRHKFAQGETIFEEGSGGHELYVLIDGRIQITVTMNHQSEQAPVHTVVPGEILGEFSLVADHNRSATAVAIKDSECFVLRRSAFRELAEEDPKLGYILLRDLGEILVERIIKTTKELKASLMF